VQLERGEAGTTLSVAISSTTNVEVALRRPLRVRLPHGDGTVTDVRLYADDPRALVFRAHEHLKRRAATRPRREPWAGSGGGPLTARATARTYAAQAPKAASKSR
jgi:hypothetical protein